jgi:hypothetical protein
MFALFGGFAEDAEDADCDDRHNVIAVVAGDITGYATELRGPVLDVGIHDVDDPVDYPLALRGLDVAQFGNEFTEL